MSTEVLQWKMAFFLLRISFDLSIGQMWWGLRFGLHCLVVEDGFLFITDRQFDFSIEQMWWGLLLFPFFFCELICYFISPNASMCWYLGFADKSRVKEQMHKK